MDVFELFGTTRDEVLFLTANKRQHYITYHIPKRDGSKKRTINAPQGRLKELQSAFLTNVLYQFAPSTIAHGFVTKRDPKTNALKHVGAKTLIKMDMRDFFGSITTQMVGSSLNLLLKSRFKELELNSPDISLLAELLTLDGKLPQGAPSSPTITNLYVLKMDGNLKALARDNDMMVTRYADDITMSSNVKMPIADMVKLAHQIGGIVRTMGLHINAQKTRLKTSSSRLSVTGVIVNEKPNLASEKYRLLRAKVHNHVTGKTVLDEHGLQVLGGELEWLRSINPAKATPLLKKLGRPTQSTSTVASTDTPT